MEKIKESLENLTNLYNDKQKLANLNKELSQKNANLNELRKKVQLQISGSISKIMVEKELNTAQNEYSKTENERNEFKKEIDKKFEENKNTLLSEIDNQMNKFKTKDELNEIKAGIDNLVSSRNAYKAVASKAEQTIYKLTFNIMNGDIIDQSMLISARKELKSNLEEVDKLNNEIKSNTEIYNEYIELESNMEQYSDLEYLKMRIQGLTIDGLSETTENEFYKKYFGDKVEDVEIPETTEDKIEEVEKTEVSIEEIGEEKSSKTSKEKAEEKDTAETSKEDLEDLIKNDPKLSDKAKEQMLKDAESLEKKDNIDKSEKAKTTDKQDADEIKKDDAGSNKAENTTKAPEKSEIRRNFDDKVRQAKSIVTEIKIDAIEMLKYPKGTVKYVTLGNKIPQTIELKNVSDEERENAIKDSLKVAYGEDIDFESEDGKDLYSRFEYADPNIIALLKDNKKQLENYIDIFNGVKTKKDIEKEHEKNADVENTFPEIVYDIKNLSKNGNLSDEEKQEIEEEAFKHRKIATVKKTIWQSIKFAFKGIAEKLRNVGNTKAFPIIETAPLKEETDFNLEDYQEAYEKIHQERNQDDKSEKSTEDWKVDNSDNHIEKNANKAIDEKGEEVEVEIIEK